MDCFHKVSVSALLSPDVQQPSIIDGNYLLEDNEISEDVYCRDLWEGCRHQKKLGNRIASLAAN